MKKLFFLTIAILSFVFAEAQKRVLDESVYDSWKTIKQFKVSDDANVTLTEYENFADKSILEIKIRNLSIKQTVKGATDAAFFNKQRGAVYKVKDSLYAFDLNAGISQKLAVSKKVKTSDDSPIIAWYIGNDLFFKTLENAHKDSLKSVLHLAFDTTGDMFTVTNGDGKRYIVCVSNSKSRKKEDGLQKDTLYITDKFISAVSVDNNSNNLLFFEAADSSGKSEVRAVLFDIKSKKITLTGLDFSRLPEDTAFNFKKGIEFSKDNDYYKFEINPVKDEEEVKPDVKKVKPAYEYELWRWNDTLLPSQKRTRESVFARQLKCIYNPTEDKFIRLSYGKGVFLMPDDNSLFGFEFDNRPYMYEDLWADPIPRDLYCVNRKTGEYRLLIESFLGSFAVSGTTEHFFTYDFKEEAWFVTNLYTNEKKNISNSIPYPVKNQSFDKPQPASPYGHGALTADKKYFLIYDEYDIWAVPVDGSVTAKCITKEYGRKNNIRFKVVNTSEERGGDRGVDFKKEILLESVNYDNMHTGFYTVKVGKEPVKLIEGAQKHRFVKRSAKGNYIIQIESFSQAPDYWLADPEMKPIERLTDLNEQTKDYKFGNTEFITWSDPDGTKQTGILYTPEDYDPTKKYPMIVYFYETMSQDIFMFYPPAPTTSTINPSMFVSRGYVVFMPDIRYEIGWPGKSCLNIVESGTKYLIDKGVADPERVGVQGHSWGGYQVAFLITQTDIFKCACSETAVANMTSAYTGLRAGAGKPRMFMYESTQSRIGGSLWEKQENYIKNSPLFYLDNVKTPLLSRHSDADEAVPYTQGLELFLGLKRLGKEVWMFNYKGDGHNIKKRDIAVDWSRRMDEYFDYYLMGAKRPEWMN